MQTMQTMRVHVTCCLNVQTCPSRSNKQWLCQWSYGGMFGPQQVSIGSVPLSKSKLSGEKNVTYPLTVTYRSILLYFNSLDFVFRPRKGEVLNLKYSTDWVYPRPSSTLCSESRRDWRNGREEEIEENAKLDIDQARR